MSKQKGPYKGLTFSDDQIEVIYNYMDSTPFRCDDFEWQPSAHELRTKLFAWYDDTWYSVYMCDKKPKVKAALIRTLKHIVFYAIWLSETGILDQYADKALQQWLKEHVRVEPTKLVAINSEDEIEFAAEESNNNV